MTREEVIELAREAGYQHPDAVGSSEDFAYFDLERFAALVAAAEREACARFCEMAGVPIDIDVWMGTKKALTAATALGLAAAIRARMAK